MAKRQRRTRESDADPPQRTFRFFKGGEDALLGSGADEFNWDQSAARTRDHLGDAMNSRHLAFLLGSGCSSFVKDGEELGVPTMAPMASKFLNPEADEPRDFFPSSIDVDELSETLGLDIRAEEYGTNLERLMEVLFSTNYLLERTTSEALLSAQDTVDSLMSKTTNYIRNFCGTVPLAKKDATVVELYQAFYRRLIFRDRSLPRPWVFTTNYDLFNETALDRLGTPYCDGFSGTVERRFNPAVYRYTLAEQLDIASRKWTSVDGYVYLCKLHGSVNWIEDGTGLFPIREIPMSYETTQDRVMIYPTPMKQNASFGSPYSDLFREFQSRVVREQSVLVVIGYSFSDEHINNLIFQALTVPTFRLVAFVDPDSDGVVAKLRGLRDPRVWMIGGHGPETGRRAHYFDTFVERFMPEAPGSSVDDAVTEVLATLLGRSAPEMKSDDSDEER